VITHTKGFEIVSQTSLSSIMASIHTFIFLTKMEGSPMEEVNATLLANLLGGILALTETQHQFNL
jgi:hypothetical protein